MLLMKSSKWSALLSLKHSERSFEMIVVEDHFQNMSHTIVRFVSGVYFPS